MRLPRRALLPTSNHVVVSSPSRSCVPNRPRCSSVLGDHHHQLRLPRSPLLCLAYPSAQTSLSGYHTSATAMATRKSARLSAAASADPSKSSVPEPPAAPNGRKRKAPAAPAPAPAPVEEGRKRKAPASPAQAGRKKKASAAPAPRDESDGEGTATPAPSTPAKRRAKTASAVPPPKTPTPSNAKLIGEPVANGTTPKPKPEAVSRLADPLATNATLLSPETSRVITSKPLDAVSPSKAASGPKTTTASLLDEANAHLIKVDARMKPLVENNHCHIFSPAGLAEKIDPFESLCSGVISQQVSGAAAKAIKKRFVDLFDIGTNARFPTPSQVAAQPVEALRGAGLSQRKAEYVRGLAEKFASGELNAQDLHDASYEAVLEKLLAVRGLGQWSVEMFACFGLKRMDVFSLGDLGVQRGMAAWEGRDVAKLKASKGGKWKYMSEREMTEISDRFAPYRSLFMWYMWRVEETEISTLE